MHSAHRDYLEGRILSASPVTIIQMLYDVAVGSLKAALDKLASGDAMGRAREVSRAQEAVAELMVSLDHSAGAAFSKELARLYAYAQSEILEGHVQQSVEALRNAQSVLTILSEGWAAVCEQTVADRNEAAETCTEIENVPTVTSAINPLAEYQPAAGSESRFWSC